MAIGNGDAGNVRLTDCPMCDIPVFTHQGVAKCMSCYKYIHKNCLAHLINNEVTQSFCVGCSSEWNIKHDDNAYGWIRNYGAFIMYR